MTPKEESEALMNEMLAFATKMLKQYGEFYPFGGCIKVDGEIVHVGVADRETENPKSQPLLESLTKTFQELAARGECKATAVVFDVLIKLPSAETKSSAVQINLDHIGGYSAEVFFPYKINGVKEVIFRPTFAQEGDYAIFRGHKNDRDQKSARKE